MHYCEKFERVKSYQSSGEVNANACDPHKNERSIMPVESHASDADKAENSDTTDYQRTYESVFEYTRIY